jgi:hypothetical protein
LKKVRRKNDHLIKFTATSALSKFLDIRSEKTNQRVLNRLIELLKDRCQGVKINASTALADPIAKLLRIEPRVIESINELTRVAEHDLDGVVRRVAEDSVNIIGEWFKERADKPPIIDVKMREEEEKG